ncbi:MAG: hypothetical protein R3C49_01380 [Planctomycetaceae bacterium]
MMTKATFIPLIPIIIPASVLLHQLRRNPEPSTARLLFMCVPMALTSLLLINALYGFEGFGTRLGELPFKSRSFARNDMPGITWPINKFSGSALGDLPVPLPSSLLQGIDVQRGDFEQGYRSYLMGEWKHGGWYYYYFVGFLVKQPIGFQVLLFASILHSIFHWRRWTASGIAWWGTILLTPLLVFGLVSSQTGFNHHMRYVLPGLPCLFVIAARTVTFGPMGRRLAILCAVVQFGSVASVSPSWLSYFNELAGGPMRGHNWLLDSNIDWGQDVGRLLTWVDAHPDRDLQAAVNAAYDLSDLGIDFQLPPPFVPGHPEIVDAHGRRGPVPGWFAISICQLKGHQFLVQNHSGRLDWTDGQFAYFMDNFEPDETVGYSIYIYHITEVEADELRRKLLREEALLMGERKIDDERPE